jgi:hypothetical protein
MKTYFMFVYRVPGGTPLDLRTPISGLTVQAMSEMSAIDRAFEEAYERFPIKPHEVLAVVRVTDKFRKAQAKLMEDDWRASLQTFEELMTATYR